MYVYVLYVGDTSPQPGRQTSGQLKVICGGSRQPDRIRAEIAVGGSARLIPMAIAVLPHTKIKFPARLDFFITPLHVFHYFPYSFDTIGQAKYYIHDRERRTIPDENLVFRHL